MDKEILNMASSPKKPRKKQIAALLNACADTKTIRLAIEKALNTSL
jgi:hypothetical protein